MCTPIELCKEDGQAVSFNLEDIDALELLSGDPHIVFSFWVGMKLATQEHILKLAGECPSVRAVAVFRDAKWTSSSDVLDALSDASCSVSLCPTASPSAHLALRCLCCGCSPQASGSSRRRSKCPCTCRASGIRRGRSEDTAVCASQTSSISSTDLGCASQMHGKDSSPGAVLELRAKPCGHRGHRCSLLCGERVQSPTMQLNDDDDDCVIVEEPLTSDDAEAQCANVAVSVTPEARVAAGGILDSAPSSPRVAAVSSVRQCGSLSDSRRRPELLLAVS